jgi:hypothetical protein
MAYDCTNTLHAWLPLAIEWHQLHQANVWLHLASSCTPCW